MVLKYIRKSFFPENKIKWTTPQDHFLQASKNIHKIVHS